MKKTEEDKADDVRNILKKKWSREWNGTQPEGLINSTGEEVDPPGWFRLIEPRLRDELFKFTVQSIQRYGGLTSDVLKDLSTKFVIDELSAFKLIRYFTTPAAESLTSQSTEANSIDGESLTTQDTYETPIEGCLEEWVADGMVAEGWGPEATATPRNDKRPRPEQCSNSPDMKRSN